MSSDGIKGKEVGEQQETIIAESSVAMPGASMTTGETKDPQDAADNLADDENAADSIQIRYHEAADVQEEEKEEEEERAQKKQKTSEQDTQQRAPMEVRKVSLRAEDVPLTKRIVSKVYDGTTEAHPQGLETALMGRSEEEPLELLRYNDAFYSMFANYYAADNKTETKTYLFEGVLSEYWKLLDVSMYRKVFSTICTLSPEERQKTLKRVMTVECWERVNKYVEDFLQFYYDNLDGGDGGAPPAMFVASDLPLIKKLQQDNNKNTTHGFIVGSGDVAAASTGFGAFPAPENAFYGFEQEIPPVVREGAVFVSNASVVEGGHKAPNGGARKRKASGNKTSSRTGAASSTQRKAATKAAAAGKTAANDAEENAKRGRKRLPQLKYGSRRYLDGEPDEYDVRYGRGGGTNNNKGNVLYLLEKLKLQAGYTLVATQKGKKAISQELVDTVHQKWGGRFVAKDPDNDLWYEVDDDVARRKASQTLREDKTPYDQAMKRKCLLRKLQEIKARENKPKLPVAAAGQQQPSSHVSDQEQKASQMLLEFANKAKTSEAV